MEDKDLFCEVVGMDNFIAKLRVLTHDNQKSRTSLSSVVESVTFPPFKFELPNFCFRYEINENLCFLEWQSLSR
jgi:hypothetical protein